MQKSLYYLSLLANVKRRWNANILVGVFSPPKKYVLQFGIFPSTGNSF